MFIGRTDAEAETPVLQPPHAKSWLIGKDPEAGREWGQEEKGMIENEMAGWHHRLDGHESEYTPGVGDGQGGLACCDSLGCKESDATQRLNWTELKSNGTNCENVLWNIWSTGEVLWTEKLTLKIYLSNTYFLQAKHVSSTLGNLMSTTVKNLQSLGSHTNKLKEAGRRQATQFKICAFLKDIF